MRMLTGWSNRYLDTLKYIARLHLVSELVVKLVYMSSAGGGSKQVRRRGDG